MFWRSCTNFRGWRRVWGEPGGEPGAPKRTGGEPGAFGKRTGGEPGAFGIHLQRVPGEKRGLWDKNRGEEFSLKQKRPNSGPENQRTGRPVKISTFLMEPFNEVNSGVLDRRLGN